MLYIFISFSLCCNSLFAFTWKEAKTEMHVETEAKAVMHIETLNNVPGFFTMHKRGWVGAGILQPPRVRPFFSFYRDGSSFWYSTYIDQFCSLSVWDLSSRKKYIMWWNIFLAISEYPSSVLCILPMLILHER